MVLTLMMKTWQADLTTLLMVKSEVEYKESDTEIGEWDVSRVETQVQDTTAQVPGHLQGLVGESVSQEENG